MKLNVNDYVQVPSTVNWSQAIEAAIQRAREYIVVNGKDSRVEICIPAIRGGMLVDRTFYVPNGVTIAGEGEGTLVRMHDSFVSPVFVFGVDPQVAREEDRPTLEADLDTSAAGGRRGVALRGDRYLQLQYHDLTIGPWMTCADGTRRHDHWEETPNVTIEFAIRFDDTQPWSPEQTIFGMGDADDLQASPWLIRTGSEPGEIVLLAANRSYGEMNRGGHGWIMSCAGTGAWHIAFQVWMGPTPTAVGFLNGTSVQLRPRNEGDPADIGRIGLGFRPNEDWPFAVGASGHPPHLSSRAARFRLAGLHVSSGWKYEAVSPGGRQVMGGTSREPNDNDRYFFRTGNTIAYLPLLDYPNGPSVEIRDRDDRIGSMLWMRPNQGGGETCGIRDIRIQSNGPGVLLGAVLDFSASRCRIESSRFTALGSVPIVASYPVRITDCYLEGRDAAVGGFRWILYATRNTIAVSGRDGWRLRGCNSTLRDTFHAKVEPYAKRAFAMLPDHAGGMLAIDGVTINTESWGFRESVLTAYPHPYMPSVVSVRGMNVGLTKQDGHPSVPVIKLAPQPRKGLEYGSPSYQVSMSAAQRAGGWVEADKIWETDRNQIGTVET